MKSVVEVYDIVLRLVEIEREKPEVSRTRHAVGRRPVGDIDLPVEFAAHLALVTLANGVADKKDARKIFLRVGKMVGVTY